MTRGAIILCRGESKRMGRDKAWRPFGPNETMLQRVVRLVAEAVPVDHITCVAAPDQQLPALPAKVRIGRDARPYKGPLAGLATGLQVLGNEIGAAFVVGCDAPLLTSGFILRMFDLLGNHQIAAPHDGERWHPLAAVYRRSLLQHVKSLLASGERSLIAVLNAADTHRVAAAEFQDVDPMQASLRACNTPAEYEAFVSANRLGRLE